MKFESLTIALLIGNILFVNCITGAAEISEDRMQPSYLLQILNKLEQGENIIFTKFGDGEYLCMIGENGANCDDDSYHHWLGEKLKEALISLSKKPNTYIGRWWAVNVCNYMDEFAGQFSVKIPWVWYHLFMNDDDFLKFDYMHKFVQFVVNTHRKKILICNKMNARLATFFRADIYIEIPEKNWSYEYEKWKNIVERYVEKDALILIAGGLCSKVLIDDITNEYKLTCIDLGSSFDCLAREYTTRGWKHFYSEEIDYYRDLLPSNWH